MLLGGKVKYIVDDKEYEVIVTKKNNKNTYIKVKPDMKIYVTTNYLATKHYIKKLLDNNKKTINKMLTSQQKKNEKNEKFYYLGQEYDIIVMPTIDKLTIVDDKIMVKNNESLNRWLKKQMKELFKERLDYNYNLFEEDIPYPILKIRTMKTRWGVCNKRDNSVTLNANLLKETIDKLDYVIIHELSHFIYFDHSKDFWNLVGKYCPNYKKIRKELKEW